MLRASLGEVGDCGGADGFRAAQVLGVCDGSGEDPRCHNSVCYLGLCTSVSDHLLYLGAHMYNGIPSC